MSSVGGEDETLEAFTGQHQHMSFITTAEALETANDLRTYAESNKRSCHACYRLLYDSARPKVRLTWFSSSLSASACLPSGDSSSPFSAPAPPFPVDLLLLAPWSALDDADASQPAFARARYCAILSCSVYSTYHRGCTAQGGKNSASRKRLPVG